MKVFLLVWLVITVSSVPSNAQDSLRAKRIEYVVGATLLFSFVDYVGFNVYQPTPKLPSYYRYAQAGLQAAITYFLYKEFGLSSAVSFNLMWWTWCDDLAFYGWIDAFNRGGTWGGRTRNELFENKIRWADWTPIALMRPSHSLIKPDALYGQALTGMGISISIIW